MFINKNFSDDCRAMSIETLDTECDDVFEIQDHQVKELRLQGLLRGLKPEDIYFYPNLDKVAYTYVCEL
jgi:hypothetical protein|tara:strand:+ start:805 stop:1011 length:207 start_codon:yes stop_codon:yes gene_type:complete